MIAQYVSTGVTLRTHTLVSCRLQNQSSCDPNYNLHNGGVPILNALYIAGAPSAAQISVGFPSEAQSTANRI